MTVLRRSFDLVAFSLLLGVLLLSCAEKTVQAPDPPAEPVAVAKDGGRVWDGTGAPPVQETIVVIKGDRIDSVDPRGTVTLPAKARKIDAKGKTVIPGLINMHGHVGMTKGLKQGKENYTRENILAQLKQYARYGVTTVMSLGTDFSPMFELRGPARADELPRAAVFTAGRGFTCKNGYPAVLPGNAGLPVEVETVDEVKAYIQELARQTVDIVKV